jgi:hypothetical protein
MVASRERGAEGGSVEKTPDPSSLPKPPTNAVASGGQGPSEPENTTPTLAGGVEGVGVDRGIGPVSASDDTRSVSAVSETFANIPDEESPSVVTGGVVEEPEHLVPWMHQVAVYQPPVRPSGTDAPPNPPPQDGPPPPAEPAPDCEQLDEATYSPLLSGWRPYAVHGFREATRRKLVKRWAEHIGIKPRRPEEFEQKILDDARLAAIPIKFPDNVVVEDECDASELKRMEGYVRKKHQSIEPTMLADVCYLAYREAAAAHMYRVERSRSMRVRNSALGFAMMNALDVANVVTRVATVAQSIGLNAAETAQTKMWAAMQTWAYGSYTTWFVQPEDLAGAFDQI